MGVRIGAATHAGRIRHNNEDAYLATPPLLAVADGMGGHAAGEVASGLAVATLANCCQWDDPGRNLHAGFIKANRRILQRALSDPAYAGMGTTLTAVYLLDSALFLAHVGDSRFYILRGGELLLRTRDHSVVGELQRSGNLTESEARLHPHRNVLTRALGIQTPIDVDSAVLEVSVGDRLLLCTDGLHGVVHDELMTSTLVQTPEPEAAAACLIQIANSLGGPDNITVIVADITEDDLQ